ncbi:MAG: hypothetical protein PVF68_09855 [Acidobacteriota bacterium]
MQRESEEHVILCSDCGMAALVPFRPSQGRRVFCPPCHRRRKKDELLLDRIPVRGRRGSPGTARPNDVRRHTQRS